MILGVGVVASDPLVDDVRDTDNAADADDADKDKDVVVADLPMALIPFFVAVPESLELDLT